MYIRHGVGGESIEAIICISLPRLYVYSQISKGVLSNSPLSQSVYTHTTIICTLGRDALHQQIALIELASAHSDVKWIQPSEFGTDVAYSPASASEKPHQQKLRVRAYLEGNYQRGALGVGYTYVVTGPFAEYYLSWRLRRGRLGSRMPLF